MLYLFIHLSVNFWGVSTFLAIMNNPIINIGISILVSVWALIWIPSVYLLEVELLDFMLILCLTLWRNSIRFWQQFYHCIFLTPMYEGSDFSILSTLTSFLIIIILNEGEVVLYCGIYHYLNFWICFWVLYLCVFCVKIKNNN